jgi:hypothetical protein
MAYVIGSDKKTVSIAKQINDKINELTTIGNFEEAERMIEVALSSPNQPFRAEFLHQVETCAV